MDDPAENNATPGPEGHPGNELGIACTSPWWLEPRAEFTQPSHDVDMVAARRP